MDSKDVTRRVLSHFAGFKFLGKKKAAAASPSTNPNEGLKVPPQDKTSVTEVTKEKSSSDVTPTMIPTLFEGDSSMAEVSMDEPTRPEEKAVDTSSTLPEGDCSVRGESLDNIDLPGAAGAGDTLVALARGPLFAEAEKPLDPVMPESSVILDVPPLVENVGKTTVDQACEDFHSKESDKAKVADAPVVSGSAGGGKITGLLKDAAVSDPNASVSKDTAMVGVKDTLNTAGSEDKGKTVAKDPEVGALDAWESNPGKSHVVYTRIPSSPDSPVMESDVDPMGSLYHYEMLPGIFNDVEIGEIRKTVVDVIRTQITRGISPDRYCAGITDFKKRVEKLEATVPDNHAYAGKKYDEMCSWVKELERKVKALQDYKDLIETKYHNVPVDLARDLWNQGFEECLLAIISRGSFKVSLLQDQSFMRLVRDKETLFNAVEDERARQNRLYKARLWKEREQQRSGGLVPGRVISGPGGTSRPPQQMKAETLAERIAAEKENSARKMFDELMERDAAFTTSAPSGTGSIRSQSATPANAGAGSTSQDLAIRAAPGSGSFSRPVLMAEVPKKKRTASGKDQESDGSKRRKT